MKKTKKRNTRKDKDRATYVARIPKNSPKSRRRITTPPSAPDERTGKEFSKRTFIGFDLKTHLIHTWEVGLMQKLHLAVDRLLDHCPPEALFLQPEVVEAMLDYSKKSNVNVGNPFTRDMFLALAVVLNRKERKVFVRELTRFFENVESLGVELV